MLNQQGFAVIYVPPTQMSSAVYTARSRQMRNALNATATAMCHSMAG
jgi:hypothetical protein